MAVSSSVAVGTGLAAAAGAAASAIRAQRQNTKPTQQVYGGNNRQYISTTPQQQSAADANNAAALRRGQLTGGAALRNPDGSLSKAGVDAAIERWGLDPNDPKAQSAVDANGNLTKAGAAYLKYQQNQAASVNPYQKDFNANRAAAQDIRNTGLSALETGSAAAEQQRQLGLGLIDSATGMPVNQAALTTAGRDLIGGYQPGAVSQAMSQQVVDANAQANLGAARSSGALGLRNALNANAQSGVQAAQNMAIQRAQEQERYLNAQVAQANSDRSIAAQAEEARQARILQQQQQGIGLAADSLGKGLSVGNAYTNAGMGLENSYLNAEQNLNTQQLAADLDYDRRKQAEGQRKSDRLWDLAGNLMSIGGKAFGAAG